MIREQEDRRIPQLSRMAGSASVALRRIRTHSKYDADKIVLIQDMTAKAWRRSLRPKAISP